MSSSSTLAGSAEAPIVPGFCGAPPPPPPPPPVPGQMPSMRISTAETPAVKRAPISGNNDSYEPPAAIQNAMLTKDKKPFTYTPGMGGKLDLSQIRSPRMARRVAKNANDEGIEGPPKSALEPKATAAQATGATNLFVQPQVAVPVFPTNVVPPQPAINRSSQVPVVNRAPSNAAERQPEVTKVATKEETKVTPVQVQVTQIQPVVQPSQPDTPVTPSTPMTPSTPGTPQVTLAKAPTPWMQNKNKPQEELPEWAKRTPANRTPNSTPDSPSSPPAFVQVQQIQQQQPSSPPQWPQAQQQSPPQWQQAQQRQQPSQQRQQPQVYQPQQKQQQRSSPPVQQQTSPQVQQHERVIPIRIEDRPSVFAVKQEPGHHQFKQEPSVRHQQRWGQPSPQNQVPQTPQQLQNNQSQVAAQSQQSPGTYIIPIKMEADERRTNGASLSNSPQMQANVRGQAMRNEPPRMIVQQRGPPPFQQQEGGPVQSRSFRVLQKITDTDSPGDVDSEQLRKLQLSEDDRILMNKFKEQVDGDNYLHQEEDPRYRGAAIPSRAFRYLQNMTESGEISAAATTPKPQNIANKKQNRNSKSFEEAQTNLPPSEQQVPEPKKYMGSAIPSRSFRILQAMTAPESVGPDATDY